MFNAVEISNILKLSQWPMEAKMEISASLPYLGEYMLSYVNSRLLATGSVYDSAKVAGNISSISLLYRNLQNGDMGGLEDEVWRLASSESRIDNEAILGFVVDVRKNPVISSQIDPVSSLVLCGVEGDYSNELPIDIYTELLSDRLSEFIQVADVYLETKRFFYYKFLNEEMGEMANLFQQMILTSPLLIGSRPRTDDANLEGFLISDWLKDFHEHGGSDDTDSFNVTNYIYKNSLAKELNDIEKDALTKILKLYTWLYHPTVSAKEIIDYETQRNRIYKTSRYNNTEDIKQTLVDKFESGEIFTTQEEQSRKPVPIIPSQPDAPPLYKIGTKDKLNLETNQKKGLIYDTPTNIDIDKEAKAKLHRQAELLKIQVKLDDLKKRKRKSNS